ncbi:endonuclease [Roseibium algae]|uniref:Endonuclease n=1 Tax=Roseibium algae TaxID=3123038 RepID=A0ABU8TFW9_9HYPH
MTVVVFILIAFSFFVLGMGGIMFIDHKFALAVDGRTYAMKGRKIDTDDPYVRRQFKKFYAIRVVYSIFLLVLLIGVVGNVG